MSQAAGRRRLAVVLVNFNGWQDTLACVRSLQDGRGGAVPSLIVVCENGSTNGSWARLREGLGDGVMTLTASLAAVAPAPGDGLPEGDQVWASDRPGVLLVDTGANLGFAGGCNVGLKLAHRLGASHFWLLNNDTEVTPGAAQALMERVDSDASIGLCGSKLVYFDQRDAVQARGGARYDPRTGLSVHLGVHEAVNAPEDPQAIEAQMDYVVGASMMLTRRTLETIGWLCEDYFLYFEELDWALKARSHGLRCAYAPDSVVFHKEGATIGSSHREGQASALSLRFLARNRLLFTRRFFPQHLPSVRRRMAFEVAVFAKRRQWGAARALLRALGGLAARTPVPQRLRVGVDFHTWDGIFQGSRSHVLGLYRAAIRQAPEVDFVFFLDDTDSLARAWPEFRAPHVRLVRMRTLPSLARLGFQLTWLRWRHRIGVLHTQYRLPLWPAGKTACTQHDLLFETHPQYFSRAFVWQSRWTFRWAARRADALFTVSEFSRHEIHRWYGLPLEAIEVTVNGVDRTRFHPAPGGEAVLAQQGLTSGGYFLNVGRLEPRKNQALLIRAWLALGPDAPPLVLVGQQDFAFQEVMDTIAALKAVDKARLWLLDKVGDEALPALMRHALAMVYPAFAEGFGMPVAEAMASGVPVITSDSTALPEVAGPAALLVSPEDQPALTRAMQTLMGQPKVARSLRQAGLVQVERFNWDASATVLLERLKRLG